MAVKKRSSDRELGELIDKGRAKRHVRRDDQGKYEEGDDLSRSLSQDARRKASTVAKPGQGNRGEQKGK
jgi:hypothetical protein